MAAEIGNDSTNMSSTLSQSDTYSLQDPANQIPALSAPRSQISDAMEVDNVKTMWTM